MGRYTVSLNSAKSYLGQTANLHLKDGSTIINVSLLRITNRNLIYKPNEFKFARAWPKPKISSLEINNISYIEPVTIIEDI